MSFFSEISDAVKRKMEEMKDKREFLDMVEQQAKPIRRKAYADQMMKEAIVEGKRKAKMDASKKLQEEKKSPMDFGIKEIEDPYKFLNTREKRGGNKK